MYCNGSLVAVYMYVFYPLLDFNWMLLCTQLWQITINWPVSELNCLPITVIHGLIKWGVDSNVIVSHSLTITFESTPHFIHDAGSILPAACIE